MQHSGMGCGKDMGQNAMCQAPSEKTYATYYTISFWLPIIGFLLSFKIDHKKHRRNNQIIAGIFLIIQVILILLVI